MSANEWYEQGLNGGSQSLNSVNKVATAAAHADDAVFAEFLKLQAYNGSTYDRVILPYEERGASVALVRPGAASAPIVVVPFRAVIGTRVASNVTPALPPPAGNGDPLIVDAAEQAYRDIRSAVFATNHGGAGGFGYKIPSAQFPSNVSGLPRWDLVYATIYIDQPSTPLTVLVKPATGGATFPVTASPTRLTSVGSPPLALTGPTPAITVLTGTPGTGSVPPSLPADSPSTGVFHFALAIVQITSTFVSGDATFGLIPTKQIQIVAPVPNVAESMGGVVTRPLSAFTGVNAATYPASTLWANGNRPGEVLPSSMVGGIKTRLLLNAVLAAGSAPLGNGATLDNSLDWRFRYFKVTGYADNTGAKFASDPTATSPRVPYVGQGALSLTSNFTTVQPYLVQPKASSAALVNFLGGIFTPIHGANTYYLALPNLVNGSKLNTVGFYLTASGGMSDGTSVFQVCKFNPSTQTETPLGAPSSPPSGALANTFFSIPTIGGPLAEIVDTTTYHYYVKVAAQTGSNDAPTISAPTAFGTVAAPMPISAVSEGQTFADDSTIFTGGLIGTGAGFAGYFSPTIGPLPQMGAGSGIGVYADMATGFLHLYYLGTPGCRMVLDIEASGPFANY